MDPKELVFLQEFRGGDWTGQDGGWEANSGVGQRKTCLGGGKVSHFSKPCCVSLAGQTGAEALMGQITPSQGLFGFLFKSKPHVSTPKMNLEGSSELLFFLVFVILFYSVIEDGWEEPSVSGLLRLRFRLSTLP